MRIIHSSNKYFTTWFIAIASMLSLTGCYDKIGFEVTRPIEEGVPTHVSLGYAAQENIVETRAEQTPEYENRIENIYLFVFNSAGQRQTLLENIDGTLRGSSLFTFNGGLNPTEGNLSKGAGTLEFVCGSLSGARIVAIANVTTGSTGTAYEVTPEELDEIQDLGRLQQFVMTMNSQSVSRGALFMMTGYAVDNESGSTSIDIAGSESGNYKLGCKLQLERTDAKVSFEVTAVPNPPEGKTWTNFSFLPKEWTVKRVPRQSYILEQEDGGDYDGQDAVYFSTPAVPFEKINPNPDNEDLYTGGSFVFYMSENNKKPSQTITDYSQREAWTTEDENGDKVFDYAHANSTYVEMTGVLSYQDNDGRQVNADVRFTVHLGYAKKEDGTADVNDYATRRNSHYTYNITIGGINDIIVEVSSGGNDPRPGYEGDVVYSNDQIFEFDSHYDRRLIKLNKKDIGPNMKWSVNTPFSRGIHDVGTEIPQNMRDYRWIKFAVNADYGVASDKYVKYPGDQNYNDPYPMPGAANDQSSPYYTTDGRNFPDARLRDIEQLLLYLQSEAVKTDSKVFDSNGDVAITVFVDENLYFNHPITNQPGEENRSLWKLTADKDDRQLHIIVEGAKYSEDGNSSVVNSKFSFKQRTIRTVFNVDKPELTTAWGLESTMETGRLGTGDVSMGTDARNGRANCLKWLEGKSWTDIIETDATLSSENALKQPYRNAAYACMLRNRDLNGDNIIDANEVRWYLASIDQLTDIYLGESALDEQSRLYPSNAADRPGGNSVYWHYTTSSYNDDEGAAWILWAEEGASRGSYRDSYPDDCNGPLYSYRCVRNLGIPLNQPDQVPTDLIEVIEEADGSYLIDVTNMSEKARRSNFEVNSLPAHNERDADNKPYAKFRVHANTFPEPQRIWEGWSRVWNYQPWIYYQTWEEYPEGYRIPNQRELLIMTTRMPKDAWEKFESGILSIQPDYVCQTAFSLNGDPPYENDLREGFLWESSTGTFFLQNNRDEKGYVRPVQDVQ